MLTGKTNAHSIIRGDIINHNGHYFRVLDNQRGDDQWTTLAMTSTISSHYIPGDTWYMTALHNSPLDRVIGGRS